MELHQDCSYHSVNMPGYWQTFPLFSSVVFCKALMWLRAMVIRYTGFWFLLLVPPGHVLICFLLSFVPCSWSLVIFPVLQFCCLPIFLEEFSWVPGVVLQLFLESCKHFGKWASLCSSHHFYLFQFRYWKVILIEERENLRKLCCWFMT